jgi:membrane protein implicated in regulation of membrane protease activity
MNIPSGKANRKLETLFMESTLKRLWKNQGFIVHVIWVCILLYAVASINVLILALTTYKDLPGAYLNPNALVGFAVISFLLVVVISAYHISSLVRRRKRRSDRQRMSRRKFIMAERRRMNRLR